MRKINLSVFFMSHSTRLLFEVLKFSLCSPAGGYLCYFRFAQYSSQQVVDTKQDIYLKNNTLARTMIAKIKSL